MVGKWDGMVKRQVDHCSTAISKITKAKHASGVLGMGTCLTLPPENVTLASRSVETFAYNTKTRANLVVIYATTKIWHVSSC